MKMSARPTIYCACADVTHWDPSVGFFFASPKERSQSIGAVVVWQLQPAAFPIFAPEGVPAMFCRNQRHNAACDPVVRYILRERERLISKLATRRATLGEHHLLCNLCGCLGCLLHSHWSEWSEHKQEVKLTKCISPVSKPANITQEKRELGNGSPIAKCQSEWSKQHRMLIFQIWERITLNGRLSGWNFSWLSKISTYLIFFPEIELTLCDPGSSFLYLWINTGTLNGKDLIRSWSFQGRTSRSRTCR